jgi:hypothetical protein
MNGINLSTYDVTVEENVTRGNSGHGFSFNGGSVLFLNNVSSGNGGDGFNINGSGLTLKGMVAKKNGADGIDIDTPGTSNVIRGSEVRNNAGTGIENEAQLTDIINNTALGNRTDIAGAGDRFSSPVGTVDQFSGNTYVTGGSSVSTPRTGFGDN